MRLLTLGLLLASGCLAKIPNPLQVNYDDGLFTPVESLEYLSEHRFTTLQHPQFPKHSVRVKKSNFCDGTVAAYTGYIDIEARHIFFYFFESRRSPKDDDVIFWTNGGPGGSSAFGLFMELGPCRVSENGTASFHPESWNEYANIFFVDQPIGVGFSYADHGEYVSTTEEAAKDIASFIAIFFEHFSFLQGRPLHMAGESYGGRYVPVFASEVYDQNTKLVKAGRTPINLASVMIGNGFTDPLTLPLSWVDMQCTDASGLEPYMPISTCVRMRIAAKRCKKWLQAACIDTFDAMGCNAANSFCENELSGPYFSSGRNPYDVSKMCEGTAENDACYSLSGGIRKYLDLPSVRKQIGVDSSAPSNFSLINMEVNTAFAQSNDGFQLTYLYVTELLERGVKVLIYVGMYDFICNWVGNEQWTRELQWTGHEAFSSIPLTEWKTGDHPAGLVRSAKGLTFATIYAAGHMAPYDKPKESLELVRKWLAGEF